MTAHTPIGLYAQKLTPEISANAARQRATLAALTEAVAEMNRTPGTVTDKDQARALQRILAGHGLAVVERDSLS